jgi:hypothetical protein
MTITRTLSLIGLLIVAIISSSCSKSDRAWEDAKKTNTVETYLAFERSFPESPNVKEAEEAIRVLEIGSLKGKVKAFLNGDTKNNTISTINGLPFKAKDQNPSTGMMFFGTSSLRVKETITNKDTGKGFSIIYQPKPNQMIESIDSFAPDEGIQIDFVNGRKYTYEQRSWKRR